MANMARRGRDASHSGPGGSVWILLSITLPPALLLIFTPLLFRSQHSPLPYLLSLSPFFSSALQTHLSRLGQIDHSFPGLLPATGFAVLAAWITGVGIARMKDTFMVRGFQGRDLLKLNSEPM